MAILRKVKKGQYTIIDNAIFRNYDLSLKAKGLLCQMLSLPDGWEFSVEGLARLSTDGRSAVSTALNELEEAGYFYRIEVRDGGKFGGVEYVISEEPIAENPITENPLSEKPISENLQQLNTKEINNLSNKRLKFIPPTVEEVEDYINERGYDIDAHRFIDYYTANGWSVGRNKMRDWRAAVRNWSRNSFTSDKKKDSGNPWMDMLEKGTF